MSERATRNSDKGARQVVKFSFYKVTPAWRLLSPSERERGKRELCETVDRFSNRLQVRSYSVVGLRGDADFLLWQIGERLDDLQALATAIMRTAMGPYLETPYSFLAMTRRSIYVSPQEASQRLHLHPAESRYFFVYPFVKTREWYALPLEERQAMMDEHIAIGRKYPSVKLNTTYSFGLDDQEFVVSFETDDPADFLDLVMELRESRASRYTLRDTPIFTCISMGLRETLDTIGAPGDSAGAPDDVSAFEPSSERREGNSWARVAEAAELPPGAAKVVYHEGRQVALFNVGGRVFAIANRCSHANGPLAEGAVEDCTVTCPYHGSRFDLKTGEPMSGPAARPLPAYEVRVEDGAVFLARGAPATGGGGGDLQA
jgi:chlorite dismutase